MAPIKKTKITFLYILHLIYIHIPILAEIGEK